MVKTDFQLSSEKIFLGNLLLTYSDNGGPDSLVVRNLQTLPIVPSGKALFFQPKSINIFLISP